MADWHKPPEASVPLRERTDLKQPRLLGEAAAAAYLGLSYWKVRELRLAGRIAHLPIDRRIYYRVDDLEHFISSARHGDPRAER